MSERLSDTSVHVVVGQGYPAWWSEKFGLVWQLLVAFMLQSGMCSFLHCISFVKYIHIDSPMCDALFEIMKSSLGE